MAIIAIIGATFNAVITVSTLGREILSFDMTTTAKNGIRKKPKIAVLAFSTPSFTTTGMLRLLQSMEAVLLPIIIEKNSPSKRSFPVKKMATPCKSTLSKSEKNKSERISIYFD